MAETGVHCTTIINGVIPNENLPGTKQEFIWNLNGFLGLGRHSKSAEEFIEPVEQVSCTRTGLGKGSFVVHEGFHGG